MTASTATRRGIPGRPRAWAEELRCPPESWEEFWEGRLLDRVGNLRVLEDPEEDGGGEWGAQWGALRVDHPDGLMAHKMLLRKYGPPPCRRDAEDLGRTMVEARDGSRSSAESARSAIEDYLATYQGNPPPLRDDVETLPPDLRVELK